MELELSLLKSEKTDNKSFLEDINSKLKKELNSKKKIISNIHKKYKNDTNELLNIIENFEIEKTDLLKKINDLKINLEKYKKSSNYFLKENDLLKFQYFQQEENLNKIEENLILEKKKNDLKNYEIKYFQNMFKSEKEITILLQTELENKKRQLNSKIL